MLEDASKRKGFEGTLRPPDGGWGWMVVLGSALSHLFIIPILQNFTFIFKDRFIELGYSSTDITTLVSLNASFGMILGLINGPLLKIFGYRKMALVGLTFYVVGLLCTGIAKTYTEFVIFYGLLSSLGMAIEMTSFSLAINSYFLKNRSKAVGYMMTLTGMGPIVMPFLISHLLFSYGLKWTVFLLSGLSLHTFVGAFLLQPVKWHMKVQNLDFEHPDKESKILLSDVHSFLEMSISSSRMSLPSHSADPSLKSRTFYSKELLYASNKEQQVKQNLNKPRKLSVTFLDNDDYKNMMSSTLHMIERSEILQQNVTHASEETLSDVDCGKCLTEPLNSSESEAAKLETQGISGLFLKVIGFLKDIYDLDLFRDPFYINIMVGLAMAFVGEIIFSTMIPLILREVGFSTEETARFLSVIAGCDLLFRFITPFIAKRLNLSSKQMYLIGLVMLLICRASMFLATYETCFFVSFGLGIGKGVRSVFWDLVLPEYVPLSKLPSASAIQSLVNGVLILVSGPLTGSIISVTKSYFSIIVVSIILTATTVLLWCGELIYLQYKKKS